MAMMQVRVARKEAIARDVFLFDLVSPDGRELPAFAPGAHIDVEASPGLVRPYSLCNDSTERSRYQIAVLRAPESRGGSLAMHDTVHAGAMIRIGQPRNHFPLESDASESLLFAGGIGVTPILCMAQRLAASGAAFSMHYCARSIERMAKALAEAGVKVSVSCEQGVCGTCLTRVLSGIPDHRDQYLLDAERAANDRMLLCCSRALTPLLELDL